LPRARRRCNRPRPRGTRRSSKEAMRWSSVAHVGRGCNAAATTGRSSTEATSWSSMDGAGRGWNAAATTCRSSVCCARYGCNDHRDNVVPAMTAYSAPLPSPLRRRRLPAPARLQPLRGCRSTVERRHLLPAQAVVVSAGSRA
jgi:hypothetical protein